MSLRLIDSAYLSPRVSFSHGWHHINARSSVSLGHPLSSNQATQNLKMGSIDTTFTGNRDATSESPASEASSVEAAIGDEKTNDNDLGDSSDEEPPFPFVPRGKVVCPTAGNNLRSNTNGTRQVKRKEPDKRAKEEEKTKEIK